MYKKSQKSGRFLVKGLRMQFNMAVVRAKSFCLCFMAITAELLDVLVKFSTAVVRNHAGVLNGIVWIIVCESKHRRYGSDAKPWGYIRQIRGISLYLSDKFYMVLIDTWSVN